MKASDARKFIGKRVEWNEGFLYYDADNNVCMPKRSGVVEEVKGKNVQISGDWKWLPDIREFRLANENNNKAHL